MANRRKKDVFSPAWTPRLLRKWDGYKPTTSGKFFRS